MSDGQPSSGTSSFFLSRAVRNSLPGRFGRAAVQSTKNVAFLPLYLNPWGDSSPIEMPNIRKRDIALFPVVTPWEFGTSLLTSFLPTKDPSHANGNSRVYVDDAYASDVISLAGDESMIEVGIGHHFLATLPVAPKPWDVGKPEGEKIEALVKEILPDPKDVKPSGSICMLRARIKHRFVDENATIKFWGEATPSSIFDPAFNVSKGWFAPYLHATNRTPYIPRMPYLPRRTQPRIIIAEGPLLWRDGDYSVATDLVETSPWVMDFRRPTPTSTPFPPSPYCIAVLLVGISPPAPLIGWSSSRRPNECIMDFSLPNMVPTLLLPANRTGVPVIAWDSVTLGDVLDKDDINSASKPRENPQVQVNGVSESDDSEDDAPKSSSSKTSENRANLSIEEHASYILSYLETVVDLYSVSAERMDVHVRRAVECLVGSMRKCGGVMGGGPLPSNQSTLSLHNANARVGVSSPGPGNAASSPWAGEVNGRNAERRKEKERVKCVDLRWRSGIVFLKLPASKDVDGEEDG